MLENAAREPEVVDLARCLIAMGAKIEGAGSDAIRIEGVSALGGAAHRVMPDRIETGTFLAAAAATGGKRAAHAAPRRTRSTRRCDKLREAGATITHAATSDIEIEMHGAAAAR